MSPAAKPPIDQKALAAAETERRKRAGIWSGGVQPHTEYQKRPVEWLVDKLGFAEHTIRWSLNPEYRACSCETEVCNAEKRAARGSTAHIWDGAVDPLAQALESIARGEDFALPSGTGTGKTIVVGAGGTMYFLACFYRSIVISLAPKEEQLLSNMWKELGDLFPRFKRHFPTATMVTGKLRMLDEEGGQEVWAATAKTAKVDAGDGLAHNIKGAHAARMLHLLEELQGVDPSIVKTVQNTSTGEFNPIGGLGNPEHQFDPLALFGQLETTNEYRISAYDHPNLVCSREVIPGAVSWKSVKKRLRAAKGDVNDPEYKAQVRGITRDQAAEALIRREWLEAAAARYSDPAFSMGALALGADPSNSERHGTAAIARGKGACLKEVEKRVCRDAGVFGSQIVAECRETGIDPLNVGVDGIGVGASTINEARRLDFHLRALYGSASPEVTIDVEERYRPREEGSDPSDPPGKIVLMAEVYHRFRDQIYFRLREDLRLDRIAIPPERHCPELWVQLLAITWERPNGKIKLITKEKLIELLGGHSPDDADAVASWNWVRQRRPAPLPGAPENPKRDPHFDQHFDKMMTERSREPAGGFVSRRPF